MEGFFQRIVYQHRSLGSMVDGLLRIWHCMGGFLILPLRLEVMQRLACSLFASFPLYKWVERGVKNAERLEYQLTHSLLLVFEDYHHGTCW